MKTYIKLLEKYDEYLKRNEVEDTDEVISAATLWNIVQNEIKKFQYYRDDNSGLISSINNIYSQEFKASIFCGITDLYDKTVENFDTKIPIFRPIKFIGIKSGYIDKNKTAVIEFILNTKVNDNKERINESIKVYRDFDDDSYYGNHINSFLVDCCREQLDEMVNTLEYFAPLVNNNKSTSQFIDNGILNITINHSLIGKPSFNIKLSKSIDPNDSQYKKYSDKRFAIIDEIKNKENELLERTPVKVNELNPFCKVLVKRYLETEKQRKEHIEEHNKVMELIKK